MSQIFGVPDALLLDTINNVTTVGHSAGSSIMNANNVTCVGYNAQPSSNNATNEITLGDVNVSAVRSFGAFTWVSDARDKTDIEPLKAGLDFINELKPVTFTWAMRDLNKDGNVKRNIHDSGFLAQDLQKVQDNLGLHIPELVRTVNPERLEISPIKLIPILVKALQDADTKIQQLENENVTIRNEISKLWHVVSGK